MQKYQYKSMSDFHLSIDDPSHCILEVNFFENRSDHYRILLQASCLARLESKLQTDGEDPFM